MIFQKSWRKVFKHKFVLISYQMLLLYEANKFDKILWYIADNKTEAHSTCLTDGTWSHASLNCVYDPTTLLAGNSNSPVLTRYLFCAMKTLGWVISTRFDWWKKLKLTCFYLIKMTNIFNVFQLPTFGNNNVLNEMSWRFMEIFHF